mgnify:CR=1 FL=1
MAISDAPAGTIRTVGGQSPFAGRGYDPLKSMTPEEEADYQRKYDKAKAEYDQKWGVG